MTAAINSTGALRRGFFFFSSRRRHTRSYGDWSSDVCSSDLDPATDSWRRIAPLPASGRGFGGAAAWDGREVLVVGDGASARAAFAYDPATNQIGRASCRERV